MFKAKSFFVVSSVLLGACAHNPTKYRPTMGADPSEIGYEAQAYINEMRQAYSETTDCKPIQPSLQNTEKEGYKRLGRTVSANSFGCVRFKAPLETGLTPQRYYEAGLTLSDIYCDDYFRRISEHKQKRQFGRSGVNDLGTAASAGLGLASAGSALTGGIGAVFGLADSLFRNYDSAFVVEPNLGKMLKLIQTAQTAYRATVEPSDLANFFDAHRAVTGYAQHCSYVGMDALLDRAIEAGTARLSIPDTVTAFQNSKGQLELNRQKRSEAITSEMLASVLREKELKRKIATEKGEVAKAD